MNLNFRARLKKGDRLILTTPGGGGYGSPADRDPEMVRNDVRDGYLSLEKAKKVYGFKETP